MNFRISNLHYNIDQKKGPLYIALCTGHMHRAYIWITGHIYSNIALSGRNSDFLGLYYRGILNKKVKILQGIQVGYL